MLLVPVALPPGVGEAGDQPASNRIADAHEHDRDGAGGLLRGDGRWRRCAPDNHVRLELDELGRQRRKPLGSPVVEAPVDLDGLPFDVAEIAHPGQELPGARIPGRAAQVADAGEARPPRHARYEATAGDQRRAEPQQD